MINTVQNEAVQDLPLSRDQVQFQIAHVPILEPPLFDSACLTLRAISHLLANLLMPVREYPVLIKSLLDDASPAHELIGHLVMTSDRLEELNTALVQLCHGTEGGAARVDVSQVAETVIDEYSDLGARGIDLHTDIPGCVVKAPFAALHNALRQLCRNAVAAMPDGGQLIVTAETLSEFDLATRFGRSIPGGGVVLAVRDTGVGLSAGAGDQLFEPFVTGRGDGLGVGLSLVYRTAFCVEGFVAYGPNPNGGACFEMILPTGQYGDAHVEWEWSGRFSEGGQA